MFKKNLKLFIGIIIGAVVFGSIGAYAASKIYANNVTVDTTNMSELGASSDVNAALTYLYGKASLVGNISKAGSSIVGGHGEDTFLGILYLDPTNLTKKCTRQDAVSKPLVKEGCMKWYVYNETDTKYIAILDHNTTDKVAWGTTIEGGPTTALSQLNSDTSNWRKGSNELTVRLISAEEIVSLIGADKQTQWTTSGNRDLYFDGAYGTSDNWTVQVAKSQGASRYYWLFDYTKACVTNGYGCMSEYSGTNGYWTTSPQNSNNLVWIVFSQGTLTFRAAASSTAVVGIRPVIEVPKSLFN